MDWTADQAGLPEDEAEFPPWELALPARGGDRRGATSGQRRSLLLFWAAPGLFAVVWMALIVVALLLPT